ncbi:unnamed protein product, partial [Nesidiocoris tenuis]
MWYSLFVFLVATYQSFGGDARVIEKPEFEDPAHDGYIIDGYLDNVKELIRHYDLATIRLPDFDFLQKSILWGVSGRNGTFKNLEDVSRVNISTLTEYDDGVTNLDTLLYIPNAQLHYRLTVLFGIDLDLDVWFFINAVHVNFNYTTGKPCNIEYNKDSIGVCERFASAADSLYRCLRSADSRGISKECDVHRRILGRISRQPNREPRVRETDSNREQARAREGMQLERTSNVQLPMHCSANLSTSAFPIQNFTSKVSSVLDYDNTTLNWAKRSGFLDRGVKPNLRMSGRVNVLIDLKNEIEWANVSSSAGFEPATSSFLGRLLNTESLGSEVSGSHGIVPRKILLKKIVIGLVYLGLSNRIATTDVWVHGYVHVNEDGSGSMHSEGLAAAAAVVGVGFAARRSGDVSALSAAGVFIQILCAEVGLARQGGKRLPEYVNIFYSGNMTNSLTSFNSIDNQCSSCLPSKDAARSLRETVLSFVEKKELLKIILIWWIRPVMDPSAMSHNFLLSFSQALSPLTASSAADFGKLAMHERCRRYCSERSLFFAAKIQLNFRSDYQEEAFLQQEMETGAVWTLQIVISDTERGLADELRAIAWHGTTMKAVPQHHLHPSLPPEYSSSTLTCFSITLLSDERYSFYFASLCLPDVRRGSLRRIHQNAPKSVGYRVRSPFIRLRLPKASTTFIIVQSFIEQQQLGFFGGDPSYIVSLSRGWFLYCGSCMIGDIGRRNPHKALNAHTCRLHRRNHNYINDRYPAMKGRENEGARGNVSTLPTDCIPSLESLRKKLRSCGNGGCWSRAFRPSTANYQLVRVPCSIKCSRMNQGVQCEARGAAELL